MPNSTDSRYKTIARELLAESADRFLPPDGVDWESYDEYTPAYLAQCSALLIDEDAALGRLAVRSGDALALRHGLSRLMLPAKLGAMLTVARDERPELFQHLLVVTLIAHYLALSLGLSERDTRNVLLSALCHDLGELFTDPALLDPRHRISDKERAYIYVHPITGYLLVRELPGVDAAVATAVLQHQERLDGSGYPTGLRGDRIGAYARLVGVADVSASILMRFGGDQRFGALTHLNRQKFDPRLLELLQDGFGRPPASPSGSSPLAVPRLKAAARLLEQWSEFRAGLPADAGGSPQEADFLLERMANLRSMLLQFGFDPDCPQLLIGLAAEDEQVASELAAALDEVHWQFADLEREITRRRENLDLSRADGQPHYLDGWLAQLRVYLDACPG